MKEENRKRKKRVKEKKLSRKSTMMRNDANAVKEELFSNSLKRPVSENVDSGSEKFPKKIKTDPDVKDDPNSPDDPNSEEDKPIKKARLELDSSDDDEPETGEKSKPEVKNDSEAEAENTENLDIKKDAESDDEKDKSEPQKEQSDTEKDESDVEKENSPGSPKTPPPEDLEKDSSDEKEREEKPEIESETKPEVNEKLEETPDEVSVEEPKTEKPSAKLESDSDDDDIEVRDQLKLGCEKHFKCFLEIFEILTVHFNSVYDAPIQFLDAKRPPSHNFSLKSRMRLKTYTFSKSDLLFQMIQGVVSIWSRCVLPILSRCVLPIVP